jgi:site-specific recombinase XerD
VFTNPDGTRLHPAQLTYEFYKIVRESELPPIRLHDVRHGTATHALTAGIDIKLVQDPWAVPRDVVTGFHAAMGISVAL